MKYIKVKFKKVNRHIDTYFQKNESFLFKILIYIDLLYSIIRYGMNLDEYFQYNFFGKRHNERKEFFIYRKRRRIITKYNNFETMKLFDDKAAFNKEFHKFIKRDWLNIKNSSYEEFETFAKKLGRYIVKPSDGYYGIGVRIVNLDVETDFKKLFETHLSENALLEEIVVQHEDLAEFNPSSVNTLRVVTMNDGNNNVEITTANFRVGNGLDKCADNFHHNGIAALIDVETGIVKTWGIDKHLNSYTIHPISKKKIVGYDIPYWQEVKKTVKKAALIKSDVGYVGWDIAIGKNGSIIIIEGNPKADPDVSQLPDKIGKWDIYKKYI